MRTTDGEGSSVGRPSLRSSRFVEEHNEEARAPKSESLGPKQRWALAIPTDPVIAVPVRGGEAYEALSVGRSPPVRRALGEIKRLRDGERVTRKGAAKRIVDVVKMFGLRKVEGAPAQPGALDHPSCALGQPK